MNGNKKISVNWFPKTGYIIKDSTPGDKPKSAITEAEAWSIIQAYKTLYPGETFDFEYYIWSVRAEPSKELAKLLKEDNAFRY